ncbi:MAG: TPM domain-containing protein, partial [Clostridia bacterium]|nr:TPM domain-containing protein [Clostridia bacterium]
MKKLCKLLAFVLVAVIAFGSVTVFAAEMYSNEYYRAVCDELTEEETDNLDDLCCEYVEKFKTDIAILGAKNEQFDEGTLDEFGKVYYEQCKFGYGENKDGLLMIYVTDTENIYSFTFGNANSVFTDDWFDFVEENALAQNEEYGVYGVMYSALLFAGDRLEEQYGTGTQESSKVTQELETITKAPFYSPDPVPYWYPADLSSFYFFHNDVDTPRVVDDADIFT